MKFYVSIKKLEHENIHHIFFPNTQTHENKRVKISFSSIYFSVFTVIEYLYIVILFMIKLD